MFYSPSESTASTEVLVRPIGADPKAYDKYASNAATVVFRAEEFVAQEGKCVTLRAFLIPKHYDAVFIPQRVLLSFFAAIFVLMMTFVRVLAFFQGLTNSVSNVANVALETILAGTASFVRLYYEKSGLDLFDADGEGVIENVLDDAKYLHGQIAIIARKFEIAYSIGFTISMIVFFYSWGRLLTAFHSNVLEARRGVWSFNPDKVKIADAANFTGIAISNGLMSFIYFAFIFTVLIFVLIWEVTYRILWYAIKTLWPIWLPILITALVNFLLKKIIVYNIITKQVKWEGWKRAQPGDFVLRRGWFHMYDLWMLIARLATGIMTALVRFFITVAVALVSLTRADVSPLPAWIERYLLLDSGSRSFQAAVKAYHHFNNPIFRVACWILTEDSKRRKELAAKGEFGVVTVDKLCGKVKFDDGKEEVDEASEAKDDESDTSTSAKEAASTKDTQITVKTRRRSGLGVLRWRLAIMLHRFPQLRYYRSHYLARKDTVARHSWKQGVTKDLAASEEPPATDTVGA